MHQPKPAAGHDNELEATWDGRGDPPPLPTGRVGPMAIEGTPRRPMAEPPPDPGMYQRHLQLIAEVRAKEAAEREQAKVRSRLRGVRARPLRARCGHGRARRPGIRRRRPTSTRAGPGSDEGPGEPEPPGDSAGRRSGARP